MVAPRQTTEQSGLARGPRLGYYYSAEARTIGQIALTCQGHKGVFNAVNAGDPAAKKKTRTERQSELVDGPQAARRTKIVASGASPQHLHAHEREVFHVGICFQHKNGFALFVEGEETSLELVVQSQRPPQLSHEGRFHQGHRPQRYRLCQLGGGRVRMRGLRMEWAWG